MSVQKFLHDANNDQYYRLQLTSGTMGLNWRETMLKSNAIVRIVQFNVVFLWLLVLKVIKWPLYMYDW